MFNPYYYITDPKPTVVQDLNPTTSGRDPVPVARAVIAAILNSPPPKDVFQPALNRSSVGLRMMHGNAVRNTPLPQGVRLEAPVYDFREIDRVVPVEAMVMRAFWTLISHIMPGTDSFRFEGMNDESLQYIERRFEELTAPVQSSTYNFIRKIVENIVKKSNAIIWIRRERASDEKYSYYAKTMNRMEALEVIDVSQVDVARNEADEVVGFHLTTATTAKLIRNRDCYLVSYQKISQDHLFGCPFVLPVLDDILSLRRIEEMLDMALGKCTFPLYHVAIGDDKHSPVVYGQSGDDNDISRAKRQFESMAPEGMYITPSWYKVEVIQPDKLADFRPYLEWYRDRVFMGLLMDGPTMGVGDTSNRNTSNTMSDSLLVKVRDIQTEVAEQITRLLIREMLVEGGFDPIGEDAVQLVFKDNDSEGRMANENQILSQYQGNMLTQTEARRLLGRKPMKPEDLDKDTFLSYSSEMQRKVDAAKVSAQAANRAKPSNQHGTSKSKPRAAKRKDSFSRLMNTFLSAYDLNPKAAAAVMTSQARGLIKAIISDLAVEGVGGDQIKTQVENQVMGLVQDILTSIDPTNNNARKVINGQRYRIDQIFEQHIPPETEDA